MLNLKTSWAKEESLTQNREGDKKDQQDCHILAPCPTLYTRQGDNKDKDQMLEGQSSVGFHFTQQILKGIFKTLPGSVSLLNFWADKLKTMAPVPNTFQYCDCLWLHYLNARMMHYLVWKQGLTMLPCWSGMPRLE